MGNCLRLQGKIVKVVKMDGKVIEYKAPVKVYQVLSEFTGCAIAESLTVSKPMSLYSELVSDHLYHLVPAQAQTPKPKPKPNPAAKKKVRFSLPEHQMEDQIEGEESKVWRVRLVITKEELRKMVQNGVVSIDNLVSLEAKKEDEHVNVDPGDHSYGNRLWKPSLLSIPEKKL